MRRPSASNGGGTRSDRRAAAPSPRRFVRFRAAFAGLMRGRVHETTSEEHRLTERVVLRFRDGTQIVLDPRSREALAMHTLVAQLRQGPA